MGMRPGFVILLAAFSIAAVVPLRSSPPIFFAAHAGITHPFISAGLHAGLQAVRSAPRAVRAPEKRAHALSSAWQAYRAVAVSA